MGDGPGLMAAPTTAALATGAPMTPTPRRPGPSGMSVSYRGERFGLVGFDGRDEGLDRDPAVGDQLAAGPAHGRSERCGPQILIDEHARDAAGIHGGRKMLDIVLRQRLGEL